MSRWINQATQIGAVIATIAGAAAVAYWIYALQAHQGIWQWPMYGALAVTALGVALMFLGFIAPDDPTPRQQQASGENSRNYQAGHDIRINDPGELE